MQALVAEKLDYKVAVRELCEFAAKQGDLDLRFTPSPNAREGIAGHELVASRRGPPYRAEVVLSGQYKQLVVRGRADGFGRRAAPVELKTFGVLRILGRGWCMDDVSECTGISEEKIRGSFHTFNKIFREKHYEEYGYIPQGVDLRQTMQIYDSMGLTGCIGSMDGVHIIWDKCPVALTSLCKGKEKVTTLVYNATVNHHDRIQACTKSLRGAKNDKTIVRFDEHMMDLKNKLSYDNINYDLYDERGIITKCRGMKHQILTV